MKISNCFFFCALILIYRISSYGLSYYKNPKCGSGFSKDSIYSIENYLIKIPEGKEWVISGIPTKNFKKLAIERCNGAQTLILIGKTKIKRREKKLEFNDFKKKVTRRIINGFINFGTEWENSQIDSLNNLLQKRFKGKLTTEVIAIRNSNEFYAISIIFFNESSHTSPLYIYFWGYEYIKKNINFLFEIVSNIDIKKE